MTKSGEKPATDSNTEPDSVTGSLAVADAETDSKRPAATVGRQFGLNELTTSLTERSAVRPLDTHERDGDSTGGS